MLILSTANLHSFTLLFILCRLLMRPDYRSHDSIKIKGGPVVEGGKQKGGTERRLVLTQSAALLLLLLLASKLAVSLHRYPILDSYTPILSAFDGRRGFRN